jgi:uncharacterized membrane protein YkvA (DUF1232 family)
MKRYATILACLAYLISPIDVLPEAVLGPFGLPDDLIVIIIGVITWLRKE